MEKNKQRFLIKEVLRDKFDLEWEWWMEIEDTQFEDEKDLFEQDKNDGGMRSQINLLNALEEELDEFPSTFESLEEEREENRG